MPLMMPPQSDTQFEQVPPGTHLGVCYRVVDLGTQETTFEGKPVLKHQIDIHWELPQELMEDGRPFSIRKRYTYSSSPKGHLRNDLEAWRGQPFSDVEFGTFDIGKLLGAGALLTVLHRKSETDGKTYINVKGVAKLTKGFPGFDAKGRAIALPFNAPMCFSLSDQPFDKDGFNALPTWQQDVIAKSPEYAEATDNRLTPDAPYWGSGEGDDDPEAPPF
jgi:hypothetical protein